MLPSGYVVYDSTLGRADVLTQLASKPSHAMTDVIAGEVLILDCTFAECRGDASNAAKIAHAVYI